jgi:anaerobic selenocysteine-containing dehydrogenase
VGLCLGGNLFGASPDATFARRALSKLDLLVMLSTTLNTGHVNALAARTLILPVLARDEEPYETTQESMFNFVRLSNGGRPRHDGPRGEVSVLAELARRVLGTTGAFDWTQLADTNAIRALIASVIPELADLRDLHTTRREFHIPGRAIDRPVFSTPTGRAKLAALPIPARASSRPDALRLMTVRSEGQFNTVVYEEEDLYRGQERRDVILLHPDDMTQRKLSHDDAVRVVSDTGAIEPVLVRAFDVRPGNAVMYYPEANVLIARAADPASRTPAFKSTWVTLEAVTRAGTPSAR